MNTLFQRANAVLPGGVNSPVRSFRAVGIEPLFIEKAQGATIYDTQGKAYVDFVCSWGPMLLGHNHPEIKRSVQAAVEKGLSFGAPTAVEVQMAELVTTMVPHMDMVRMVNSGTEAVMSALRLARAYTGRAKIIKFAGCYHGHSDAMLVRAGSGALDLPAPDSAGVTQKQAGDTLLANYNDLDSVAAQFAANPQAVAAIIVEPLAANMGVVLPKQGFLQGLRQLCDQYGALLIFDEVITGFRLCAGGAQSYYGVRADLVTFGKIIGGGMPVGAYGGARKYMELVAPLGPMYQAGTLSGNPIAMSAGFAQLSILHNNPQLYTTLASTAKDFATALTGLAKKYGAPATVNQAGSLICLFFTKEPVTSFAAAQTSSTALYAAYFCKMLEKGVYLAPAQFEAMFLSTAHTKADIAFTLQAAEETFAALKNEGAFA